MVRLGKTYGNLMVDLQATNRKLVARTLRIAKLVTGLADEEALALLDRCDGELKTAIVSHKLGVDAITARSKLDEAGGSLRRALGIDG
jgi:N-acetylmuramic acid 6-phosphate etherase